MDQTEGAGVLLPDVDPNIGEIVLTTLQANPEASLAEIAVGLIAHSPAEEVAVELMNALIELTVCKHTGQLRWVEQSGQSILLGIRRMTTREALKFGDTVWPIGALMFAQPKSVTIDTGQGRQRVYIAAQPLHGVVVRQSEAIALGNAMIETWGGRIIEDRSGPEVMQQSAQEQKLTKRARMRAQALTQADRMTVEAHRDRELRPGHARAALAEAWPGRMPIGTEIMPERDEWLPDARRRVFVVEKRVNESWCTIVAKEPGAAGNVDEATAWVRVDGRYPDGSVYEEGGPPLHCGFTDEPAIAQGGASEPGDEPAGA